VVIILISFPIAKNASRRYNVNKEIKELEKEIKQVGEKNIELSKLIDYLNSDQNLEEYARLNFELKKKGENVVVVDNGGNKKDEISKDLNNKDGEGNKETIFNIPGLENAKPVKSDTNPEKWRRYFFAN
jgi:uncharacterized protein YeeX (DUF496 family)